MGHRTAEARSASPVLFGYNSPHRAVIAQHLDRARYGPHFWEDLPDTADLEGFAAVCPLTLADYPRLEAATEAGRLRPGAALAPSAETVAVLHDKRRFDSQMRAMGWEDLLPEPASADSRALVIKPARGAFGIGARLLHGRAAAAMLHAQPSEDTVVQTVVPGRFEYATHILAVAGDIRWMETVRYEMRSATSLKGRDARPVRRAWIDTPRPDLFAAVIGSLAYTGTCCIDYKLAAGSPILFEINPRVGASLTQRLDGYLARYLQLTAGRPAAPPIWGTSDTLPALRA